MAAYRLEYHPGAIQDLLAIHSLIADYAGKVIADRKIAEIEMAVYRLAEFPKIGSLRDEIRPGLRVIPIAEKACLCFAVEDESRTVLILCIGYAGSNWASRIKERD